MPTPSRQFREDREDQEEGPRSSDIFCNDREFTTFFFDEEMHLLTNEIAMADRYNELMKYEHLDTPIMEPEPIANYENLMPGRHRRSGNERVHPCNLHTAFSRSNPNLNIDLPSWIDIDPTGENKELNYWQEQINNAYVEATKEIMVRERLFRAQQLELDILEIQRTAEARKATRSLSNSDEWLGSQSITDDKDYPLEIFEFSDNELDSNSD
uniref:CFAP91 domain-containing protein n=1 Tax=Heterorhabditis bacteriophora TaxID=37862 RepID=A0A1I7XN34_HETBA